MESYKTVRAIARGLEVLAAVNRYPNAPVAELSKIVGLHRTTVYRILETLEGQGYLLRRVYDDTYQVTYKVDRLGGRTHSGDEVIDVATPFLRDLIERIDWPCSIVTVSHDAMSIRDTTHGRAKIQVHDARVGTRVPILVSAVGRAYLAFASESKCHSLIENMKRSPAHECKRAREVNYLNKLITGTRNRGYAVSIGEYQSWLGSIGMPIRTRGEVVACMNVVFLTAAMDENTAVRRYLPTLEKAVHDIEDGLEADSAVAS